ncbi:MAG TPA: GNAT family N-acetyltransferase [Rhodanobacteraceae bacterium]
MPDTDLNLRPASMADRELFWRLAQTMRAYVDATWGWDDADQQARFAGSFDPAVFQVIEHAGMAIGGLRVDLTGSPVRLLNIQVLPAFQRRGYGSRVIRHVLVQAGTRQVWLQVLKVNPARELYERLGFTVTGSTTTHWHMLRDPCGVMGSLSRPGAASTR